MPDPVTEAANAAEPAAGGSAAGAPTGSAGAPPSSRPAKVVTSKNSDRRGRGRRMTSGRTGSEPAAVRPLDAQPLDKETANALTLFNTYLEADREHRKTQRAISKVERSRADAAAKVRRLSHPKASAEELATAEAAYREAVETLNRLKASIGEEPSEPVA